MYCVLIYLFFLIPVSYLGISREEDADSDYEEAQRFRTRVKRPPKGHDVSTIPSHEQFVHASVSLCCRVGVENSAGGKKCQDRLLLRAKAASSK